MKALAIIGNVLFPGIGSFFINKVGEGIGQLVLYILGLIFTFTVFGAIFGIPMMIGAWIWGVVIAANANPEPQTINVIHTNGPRDDENA